MRTLLFVQTGDARPKCCGPTTKAPEYARGNRYSLAFGRFDTMYGTHRQHAAQVAADRWWLVECANADAGRELVAVFESQPRSSFMSNEHRGGAVVCASRPGAASGRILASGGQP